MTEETAPVRDPKVLRAFAHPVRLRLYEALLAGGPATAAQLARSVPGAPGSLSYHLRTLAGHGFVQETSDSRADGRERWWRAVPGGAHWVAADLEASPGMREASALAQEVFLARQQERLRGWLRRDAERFGPEWRAAAISSDVVLHLDATELTDLGRELDEVVDKWLSKSRANRAAADTAAYYTDGANKTKTETSLVLEQHGAEPHHPVFLVLHAFPFSTAVPPNPPAGDEQGGDINRS